MKKASSCKRCALGVRSRADQRDRPMDRRTASTTDLIRPSGFPYPSDGELQVAFIISTKGGVGKTTSRQLVAGFAADARGLRRPAARPRCAANCCPLTTNLGLTGRSDLRVAGINERGLTGFPALRTDHRGPLSGALPLNDHRGRVEHLLLQVRTGWAPASAIILPPMLAPPTT